MCRVPEHVRVDGVLIDPSRVYAGECRVVRQTRVELIGEETGAELGARHLEGARLHARPPGRGHCAPLLRDAVGPPLAVEVVHGVGRGGKLFIDLLAAPRWILLAVDVRRGGVLAAHVEPHTLGAGLTVAEIELYLRWSSQGEGGTRERGNAREGKEDRRRARAAFAASGRARGRHHRVDERAEL